MCVEGLLVTLVFFNQLRNVLAKTPVTKAGTILETQAAKWAAHFKATARQIKEQTNTISTVYCVFALLHIPAEGLLM